MIVVIDIHLITSLNHLLKHTQTTLASPVIMIMLIMMTMVMMTMMTMMMQQVIVETFPLRLADDSWHRLAVVVSGDQIEVRIVIIIIVFIFMIITITIIFIVTVVIIVWVFVSLGF